MGKRILFLLFLPLLLTGCLYPGSGAENQETYDDQLAAVQAGVDQFQEDQDILPLANRDADTPKYERYVIDFSRLVPRYMQEPPPNSFENGGSYQYVLVDVEENPEVKVLDLTIMPELQRFEQAVNSYIASNGFAPVEEPKGHGIFTVDEERLDYDGDMTVESPYFQTELPLLINEQGQVVVDYSLDIKQVMNDMDEEPDRDQDLRELLIDEYPIVPAFSVPYKLDEEGEPVIDEPEEIGEIS
ncbi:hypothetical protein [Salsuginibacillus kocurii]|uniref:hypothetical protein n=1 Tax=Salsuginibacillus kocurii TaxID=427078 RepID=UPI000376690B|nr:hypothetical protein [Salsuginibacillus kocurii]